MRYTSFAILLIVFERTNSFFVLEFDLCKLTNSGSEYVGKVSQTTSNEPCQSWTASKPHCGPDRFSDDTFPDGGKASANNYCRNPDLDKQGPWCFSLNPRKDREPCKLPTCSNPKCRWTGIGLEYTGPLRVSLNQRECSPWSTDAKLFKALDEFNRSFPEGNRMLASRGCRNPTEDPGGPWCYVGTSEDILENVDYQKEYCDIPFCFPSDGVNVIDNNPGIFYTHFTEVFHHPTDSVDITFKLWAPGDWNVAELRIALSSISIPATGEEMRKMAFGYEVVIKNRGATITKIEDETEISIIEPGLINGLTWTNLTVSRSNSKLYVKITNSETPLMVLELIDIGDTIIEREKIKYISFKSNVFTLLFVDYSVKNDGSLSEMESEERELELEEFCPIHITNSDSFAMYFLLRKVQVGGIRDLHFYVRGLEANIKLTVIPGNTSFPYILIQITECIYTIVLVDEFFRTVLVEGEVIDMLSIWKWSHFQLSLSGHRMQLFMHLEKEIRMLHDVSNPQFTPIRWFAASSHGHAKWTFFCEPVYDMVLEPYPPECRVSTLGSNYVGHQSFTKEGYPCIPWSSRYILRTFKDTEFPDGTVVRAVNYCRNPTDDPRGPYCYARDLGGDINEFSCNLRNCTYSDCRLAGTGDDYMGTTSVTRSNKTCQSWTVDRPHSVDHSSHKNEGFPERSPKKAQNYCRNPNRDVGGPWCYTTDHDLVKDLCSVPDCHEPETCTVIVRGQPNHRVFIDPMQRTFGIKFKAKIWNPSEQPELSFTFYPEVGRQNITFVIGAEKREFLQLYFYNSKGKRALLKQYAYPHILSSGQWTAITLMAKKYEFFAKYTDASEPFFSWKYACTAKYYETLDEDEPNVYIKPFTPMYFSYAGGSRKNDFVGLSFPCNHCHTERVKGPNLNGVVYYPMNLWKEGKSPSTEETPKVSLKIHLRGKGAVNISFYGLPSSEEPVAKIQLNKVTQDGVNRFAIFARKKKKMEKVYLGTIEGPKMYSDTEWTAFFVEICTMTGLLKRNDRVIGDWRLSNMPIYFFTVEACDGVVLWTATCDPPDVDRDVVNGGWSAWSPWTCSTSCGGGIGFRTRTCTNPRPSIYGEACTGDDFMVGPCNVFPCGRISPYTLELLREELRITSSQQIKIGEGFGAKISCSPQRLRMVKAEEPTAQVQWEKNAIAVAVEATLSEVDENNYNLVLSNVTRDSTGVYACIIHTSGGILIPGEITTVVVATVKPSEIRTGELLVLSTNAEVLGKVYGRLTVEWLHNSEIYRLYDFDNDVHGNETIYPVTKEFEGTWECRIHQESLGLIWYTNFLMLEVQPKSHIADHLFEGVASNPIKHISYTELVLAIIIVTMVGLLYTCVHLLVRRKKNKTAPCEDMTPLLTHRCTAHSRGNSERSSRR